MTPETSYARDGDVHIAYQVWATATSTWCEHIAGVRLVEVPGSDHQPLYEHPAMFIDEIEEFLTGSRTAFAPERRLATVLFSDIAASTERAVAAGDTHWRELLDRHHRVVRAELAEAGEVLVSRTVKDLVAGSGIEFQSKGIHTLKGVPDDWELFTVT